MLQPRALNRQLHSHDPYLKGSQLLMTADLRLKGRERGFKSRTFFTFLAACLMGLVETNSIAGTAEAETCDPPQSAFLAKLQAVALMETLNADLLASRSATLTLDRWCADHRIADNAQIFAKRIAGIDKNLTAEQRERLQIGNDEPVRYRRVFLMCGDYVLSEADNWYVASRLTPEMNKLLDESDTPFGRVVQPLHPTRETFAMEVFYQPLDKNYVPKPDEKDTPLDLPEHLFEHRALLFDAGHQPFSEVHEIYTREILSFLRQNPK